MKEGAEEKNRSKDINREEGKLGFQEFESFIRQFIMSNMEG